MPRVSLDFDADSDDAQIQIELLKDTLESLGKTAAVVRDFLERVTIPVSAGVQAQVQGRIIENALDGVRNSAIQAAAAMAGVELMQNRLRSGYGAPGVFAPGQSWVVPPTGGARGPYQLGPGPQSGINVGTTPWAQLWGFAAPQMLNRQLNPGSWVAGPGSWHPPFQLGPGPQYQSPIGPAPYGPTPNQYPSPIGPQQRWLPNYTGTHGGPWPWVTPPGGFGLTGGQAGHPGVGGGGAGFMGGYLGALFGGGGGGGFGGGRGFYLGGGPGPDSLLAGILPGGQRARTGALTLGAIVGGGLLSPLASAASPLLPAAGVLGGVGAANIAVIAAAYHGLGDAIKGNKEALDALDPVTRKHVDTLRSYGPELEKVTKAAREGMFPGVTAGLQQGLTHENLQLMADGARTLGSALGDVAQQWGRAIGSREFTATIRQDLPLFAHLTREGGDTALHFATGLGQIMQAALPFTQWLSGQINDGAEWFEQWARNARLTGELADRFAQGADDLTLVANAVKELLGLVYELGVALAPFGRELLAEVASGLERMAEWVKENREEIEDITTGALRAFVDALQLILKLLAPLYEAALKVADALGGWENVFKIIIAFNFASVIAGWTTAFFGMVGGIAAAQGALAKFLPMLAGAVAAYAGFKLGQEVFGGGGDNGEFGPGFTAPVVMVADDGTVNISRLPTGNTKPGSKQKRDPISYDPSTGKWTTWRGDNPNHPISWATAAGQLGTTAGELRRQINKIVGKPGGGDFDASGKPIAGSGVSPGTSEDVAALIRQYIANLSASPASTRMGSERAAGRAGIAEAFYDPLGSYDEGAGGFGGAIGGHGKHVHLSFKDPKTALEAIKYAKSLGLRVDENPYVGSLNPTVHTFGKDKVKGTADDSFHYKTFPGTYGGRQLGQAIDVTGDADQLSQLYRYFTAGGAPGAAGAAPMRAPVAGLDPARLAFAQQLAAATGLSPDVIYAWSVGENTPESVARRPYNWLNLKATSAGRTYSGVGVANLDKATDGGYFPGFNSLEDAVKETAYWLNEMPRYRAVRASASKGPQAQLAAISASGWGTGSIFDDYKQLMSGMGTPTDDLPTVPPIPEITSPASPQSEFLPIRLRIAIARAGTTPATIEDDIKALREAISYMRGLKVGGGNERYINYLGQLGQLEGQLYGLLPEDTGAEYKIDLGVGREDFVPIPARIGGRVQVGPGQAARIAARGTARGLLADLSRGVDTSPMTHKQAVTQTVREMRQALATLDDVQNTYEPKIRAIQLQLSDEFLTNEQFAVLKARMTNWRRIIDDAVSDAQRAVEAHQQEFATVWGNMASAAIDAFNEQSAKFKPPSQILLDQLNAEREKQALQDALAEAHKQMERALASEDAGAALDQIRQTVGKYTVANLIDKVQSDILGGAHRFIGEGLLEELRATLGAAHPDLEAVKAAQKAIDDAEFAIRAADLRDKAEMEQQAHDEMRARQLRALEAMAADWARYYEQVGGNIAAIKGLWLDMLASVDPAAAADLAGSVDQYGDPTTPPGVDVPGVPVGMGDWTPVNNNVAQAAARAAHNTAAQKAANLSQLERGLHIGGTFKAWQAPVTVELHGDLAALGPFVDARVKTSEGTKAVSMAVGEKADLRRREGGIY